DFEKDPLLKLWLIKVWEGQYILVLVMPSLSSDVKSLENLFNEVILLYSKLQEDSGEDVFQFLQYSEWHNELLRESEEEALNFWKKQTFLEHLDIKLALEVTTTAKDQYVLSHTIEIELAKKLETLAHNYGVS